MTSLSPVVEHAIQDSRRSIRRSDARFSSDATTSILAAATFFACICLRSPQILLKPRFWVEEGSLYYAQMQHLSFWKAMAFVGNGNYQFATNAILELALLVKARHAAMVTTYLSSLAAAWCCVLIARFMAARSCSPMSIATACGLFALQMSGYEVLLNATNVQWVCSAITLFLLLAEDVPPTGLRAFGRYTAIAGLGMTGVTSCILLPVAALVALVRRSRHQAIALAVLAAATAVQSLILATHAGNSARALSISADALPPLALQGVLAGLLPPAALDAIGAEIAGAGRFAPAVAFQIVVLGSAGLAAVAAVAVEPLGRWRTGVLCGAALSVTLVNEFGALGATQDFMSSYGGSRYFFLASTCVIVMLASGLSARAAWRRHASATLLAVFASNAVLTVVASPLPSVFFSGKALAEQVDACGAAATCPVHASPDADWTRFDIGGARLR